MAGVVVLVGVLSVAWARWGDEVIPHFMGVGFDGWVYRNLAQDPSGVLSARKVSGHHIQRVGPAVLVHVMMRLAGAELTAVNVVTGFQVLNFSLAVFGCYLWMSIVRVLGLRRPTAWFGFAALFLNYAMLKFIAYRPVLTDAAGFTLSLALVGCVVQRRRLRALAVSVLAAATWPTVLYSGLLLFVMPDREVTARPPGRLSRWVAAFVAAIVPVAALGVEVCGRPCSARMSATGMVRPLLPFSVLAVGIFLYLATRPLLDRLHLHAFVRSVHWPRLVTAVAVLVVVLWAWATWSDGSGSGLRRTLMNILQESVNKPGGFLVAHTMYVGPGVVVVALLWRRVVEVIARLGPGMVLVMLGFVVLSIGAETRKLINLWPFFAVMAAVVIDERRWDGRQVLWFSALSVAMSRVWLPITQGTVRTAGMSDAHPDDRWLLLYRASIGPWMTLGTYAVMLTCTLVAGLAVWLLLRHDEPTPAERGQVSA
jgi:hypothetical protein